jgi:hypothetical protein
VKTYPIHQTESGHWVVSSLAQNDPSGFQTYAEGRRAALEQSRQHFEKLGKLDDDLFAEIDFPDGSKRRRQTYREYYENPW